MLGRRAGHDERLAPVARLCVEPALDMCVHLILRSVITCPECGVTTEEGMPTDACLFFYECKGCRKMLKPVAGDCCVFCSFGSVKCPPVQLDKGCCA